MKIIRNLEFQGKQTAVCIGKFDGIHRGHRLLIEQAKKENKPIVMISFSVDEAKVLYTPYEKEKLAEYIFNKIIISGCYQIESAKKINNKSYLSDLFEQQEKNIKLCLKINNFEWFKKYIRKINLIASENEDKEILENLYNMNESIGINLLDQEKTYFEWFIKEIYNLNLSLKYLYDNVNFKYFAKLITILLKNTKVKIIK